jgi:hypothetical protein
MTPDHIDERLREIDAAAEPSIRILCMAQLLRDLFEERGSRIVVVGGSAIELLTDGRYASGDVDICFRFERPPMRVVAEIMAQVGATGGVRSFKRGSLFIDILGPVETLAKTDFREIDGVSIAKPEDLIAERVLMSIYPQPNEQCRACAEILLAVALSGELPVDWNEVERVAALPEYEVLDELQTMKKAVATRCNISPGETSP